MLSPSAFADQQSVPRPASALSSALSLTLMTTTSELAPAPVVRHLGFVRAVPRLLGAMEG
jgi:hypothetical protein